MLFAFEALFHEMVKLPEDLHRAVALASLPRIFYYLAPEENRRRAFKVVLDEMARLPQELRGAPLTELTTQIHVLPEQHRMEFFKIMLAETQKQPEDMRAFLLCNLAEATSFMGGHREAAFDAVLKELKTLRKDLHAKVRLRLADRVHNRKTFHAILDEVGKLPCTLRCESVSMLHGQIDPDQFPGSTYRIFSDTLVQLAAKPVVQNVQGPPVRSPIPTPNKKQI
jgi:hypothetical protein